MLAVQVVFGEGGKSVDQVDLLNLLLTGWRSCSAIKPPICIEYLEDCQTWEEMSQFVNVLRDNNFEVISVTSGSMRPDWLRDVTYRIVLIFGDWLKYRANEYYYFPDRLEDPMIPDELMKAPLPSLTLHPPLEASEEDILEFLRNSRYSHWRVDKTVELPLR
jgi:hypothetical protein